MIIRTLATSSTVTPMLFMMAKTFEPAALTIVVSTIRMAPRMTPLVAASYLPVPSP